MAGEGDAERLVVLFESRLKDFEKAQARIEKTTSAFAGLQRQSRSATRQMESDVVRSTSRINQALAATSTKIGAFAKSFAGGFIGGLSVQALASAVTSIVADVAKIADVSAKIGVGTEALQELRFAAGQSGVEIGALETSLEQFGKRIGEASRGAGELFEVLKANGVQIRDQDGNIRPLAELLADYAELIRLAGSEQERLTLANIAFGRSGGDMVLMLNQGASGLATLQQAARDAGTVIRDDLVKTAAEVDDEWEKLTSTMSTWAKSTVLSVIQGIRNIRAESQKGFGPSPAAELGRLTGAAIGIAGDTAPKTVAELMAALGLDGDKKTVLPTKPGATDKVPSIAEVRPAVDQTRAGFDDLNDSIRQSIDLAQGFASGLLADLRNGVSATDALRGAFGRLADQLLSMAMNAAINSLFGALLGGLGGGRAGFVGAGGIPIPGVNPFIGRASGGPVTAGRPYIVGERRPELFVPSQNGTILPSVPAASPVNVSFAPTTNITIQGSTDDEAMFRLRAELDKRDDRLRREVPALVWKAQRDRTLRG